MPPTFTDREKHAIREQLLAVGRELFTTQGLKKTSLEELTRSAGIAKSSFYLFFPSKEALYLELLAQEASGVEERVLAPSFGALGDAGAAIERFLTAMVHELETNALTRRLLTHPEELQMIARRVTPEQMATKFQRGALPIIEFVQAAQASGQVIDASPEVIAGVIRAVTMLTLHKDDIGPDMYSDVLALIIRLIAQGLRRPADEGADA